CLFKRSRVLLQFCLQIRRNSFFIFAYICVILTNMSAAPGVLCSICMECFNKDDCVDSKICGHMYHSTCIQNWLTRSKQCPKCRMKCRGTRKLFLDFDDTGDEV
ncbi:hypothetical protein GQX74_001315, partial [Glossina fuscipes]